MITPTWLLTYAADISAFFRCHFAFSAILMRALLILRALLFYTRCCDALNAVHHSKTGGVNHFVVYFDARCAKTRADAA